MTNLADVKDELTNQMRNPNMIKRYTGQANGKFTVEVTFGAVIDFNSFLRERIVSMDVQNAVVAIKFTHEPVKEVKLND